MANTPPKGPKPGIHSQRPNTAETTRRAPVSRTTGITQGISGAIERALRTSYTYVPQPEKKLGRICVFASAQNLSEDHMHTAFHLGRMIGENGYDLVYGGSDLGLMGMTAAGTRSAGRRVIGILPGTGSSIALKKAQWSGLVEDDDADLFGLNDETIGAGSLENRKLRMLSMSDAVIALPGGLGTFDEIATTLEQRRKTTRGAATRLAIVNTSGMYDGLRDYLDNMFVEGSTRHSSDELAYFAPTASHAVEHVLSAIDIATTPRPTTLPPRSTGQK